MIRWVERKALVYPAMPNTVGVYETKMVLQYKHQLHPTDQNVWEWRDVPTVEEE